MQLFKVLHSREFGDTPGVVAAGLTARAAEQYVAHHTHLPGAYFVMPWADHETLGIKDEHVIAEYKPGSGDASQSVTALMRQNEDLQRQIAAMRDGMSAAVEAKFQEYMAKVAKETTALQREASLRASAADIKS